MSTAAIRASVIRELENEAGGVTARALLDAARNKGHPLHNDFTWDNVKAGDKYRLLQARAIIRSVRVTTTVNNRRISSVAYVRDPSIGNAPGYRSVAKIRSEEETALDVLLGETNRVAAIMERAVGIAAVLDLEDEFRAALAGLVELQTKVKSRARPREEQPAEARV